MGFIFRLLVTKIWQGGVSIVCGTLKPRNQKPFESLPFFGEAFEAHTVRLQRMPRALLMLGGEVLVLASPAVVVRPDLGAPLVGVDHGPICSIRIEDGNLLIVTSSNCNSVLCPFGLILSCSIKIYRLCCDARSPLNMISLPRK
jgi:hypothetical protein